MKELATRIEIDAPTEKVWETLMNFKDYPQWNPFVQFLLGEARVGGTLHALLAPPGGSPMVFHPRVLKIETNKEFRWKGKFWFQGLFDGEHYFQLQSLGHDRSLFIQGETFTGILVPFLKKMLQGPTAQGFRAMNEALKIRVERTISAL